MTSPFVTYLHDPEAASRPAFVFGDTTLTYGELATRAHHYARGLAASGVCPGDRVALMLPSCPQLVIALLAHLEFGFVHVPINTRYRGAEVAHILTDSGASALIAATDSEAAAVAAGLPNPPRLISPTSAPFAVPPPGQRSQPPQLEPASPDALGLIIYTSGTTGRSKGVMLSQRALAANVGATTGLWRFSKDDTLALALPLFHVHGLGLGVLGTMLHGMTSHVLARFSVEGVLAALRAGATIFMGVPTMHHRLLEHLDAHPADTDAFAGARLFTSGSAALPASDHERFETHTGTRILERYGMSETGFTLSNPYDGERRAGTVGFAVPGYEAELRGDDGRPLVPDATGAVGEPGEIWVRGNGLMDGYWQNPTATAASFDADGWFQTGDVATCDADGYFRIVGRKSVDIIKSGGFKLSAREIEDVLLGHPSVSEAAVVGVADPAWGERICAAIVRAPNASDTSDDELADALPPWVSERLASYKKPRAVIVLERLPKNALGKVQKHRLRPLFDVHQPG